MSSAGKYDNQGTGEWKNGICGCFADCTICILTFIAPCYVVGKNAEYMGESCMTIGFLYMIGLSFQPVMRWRIRQHKGIEGSMCSDLLYEMFCGQCALIQEANELGWHAGGEGGEGMARE